MIDPEELKRKQARRSQRTAIVLALIALAIYVGFFWDMGHKEPGKTVAAGHAATSPY